MSERVCAEESCGLELSTWARADARYCCDACRQKAYRWRKQILDRYGSWENALDQITTAPLFMTVMAEIRNIEED